MMRNLESSAGRPSPFGKQALILVSLAIVLCALGYSARPYLAGFAVPLFGKSVGVSGGLWESLATLQEKNTARDVLVAENADLREKLATSEMLVLDRNQLYEENVALKELWGRAAEPNRLLAAVLLRPSATPYDTLVIDVGSEDGVSTGDRVAAGGTLLIGTIDQVFPQTARVSLYSSPGKEYEGFLRGTSLIKVIGQGGGSLRAEVPYDAQVVEGDSISLPQLEANTAFVVEHVEVQSGNSSAVAYLRLPVSLFNLRFVEVWRQATH